MIKDNKNTKVEFNSKYSNYTKKGDTKKESNLISNILKEKQKQQNGKKKRSD